MRRCRTRRASSALWIASLASRTRQRSARRRRWSLATWSPRRQPWRCCHTRLLTVGSARPLRLGTRGSRLALVQSEIVAARLRASGAPVEVRTILSEGDVRAKDAPIGEGIFVTALERALVAGEIDIAVHSAKDLPLEEDPNLVIAAGLDRLDLGGRIATRIDGESMPPAPAQGALAVQARRDDAEVLDMLGRLDDPGVRLAVVAERALLKAMGGGCRAPVGAVAVQVDGVLTMLAGAVTPDGRSKHLVRLSHDIENGGSLARAVTDAAHELKRFVSLHSRAVIDTRPELVAAEREAIESEGFRVLHVPAIAIGSAGANGEIERARSRVGEYDWVVVTSKRGVSALLDGVQSPPSNVRWAAVGATTAKALRDRGVRVDVVPASARGDAIPHAMAKLGTLSGSRVLLARADIADNALPQKLITMS